MEFWLPLVFAGVMGLALLLYVVLDGYDLGVGLLLPFATDDEKDVMIASIGPFWDANETWIVLGVGVLLIAFPAAHGLILTSLYLPATLMLMGLVLRGIAFDFRVKADSQQKAMWNQIFSVGSLLASLCQGWMLGAYITGLQATPLGSVFALLAALALPTLYLMLGACWLMCKTERPLASKARKWAQTLWLPLGLALLVISIATPLVSPAISAKWFVLPQLFAVLPIPLAALLCYVWLGLSVTGAIRARPATNLFLLAALCALAAIGLAYSLYPDIIIGRLSLHLAAAATESLLFTLWGVLLTVPMILGYTFFVYRIFSGRQASSSYES
jgi:cytochrome bd ubiquinol oxidase subunit II